jgi:hypothetical protein
MPHPLIGNMSCLLRRCCKFPYICSKIGFGPTSVVRSLSQDCGRNMTAQSSPVCDTSLCLPSGSGSTRVICNGGNITSVSYSSPNCMGVITQELTAPTDEYCTIPAGSTLSSKFFCGTSSEIRVVFLVCSHALDDPPQHQISHVTQLNYASRRLVAARIAQSLQRRRARLVVQA